MKNKLEEERKNYTVYPEKSLIFAALNRVELDDVKVVIIGQDPYFDGNATGVAFECAKFESPSLKQINSVIKYLYRHVGFYMPTSLNQWTKQGVLLLNIVLTVRAKVGEDKTTGAKSHYDIGWQDFTHQIIREVIARNKPVVFLLWGSYAKEQFLTATLGIIMDYKKTLIVESNHPAYSAYKKTSWETNDCFNKTNDFLTLNNLKSIKWLIQKE